MPVETKIIKKKNYLINEIYKIKKHKIITE